MNKNNIIILSIFAFFACNHTSKSETADKPKSSTDCIDNALSNQEIAKIRLRIDADNKAAKIRSFFERKSGFNGNVLIAQDGIVLYQNSFGYSVVEKKDSLQSDSKFQLASLSKTFTAIATLKLWEEGKLSLEDTIRKFIPAFPYSKIQIKSLLSHRSGLPNYAYVLTDSVRKVNKFPSNADIVRWYCAVKPKPYNSPNRYFSYSNTNYALLATIIEKVSGMSFEDYLRKNIFMPLGMKNTWLVTSKNDSLNYHKTAGYQYNRRLPKDNFDDVVGDKGVYSTTEDLFKWYVGLTKGCVVSQKALNEAFVPRSFERKGIRNYGYGFRMHVDQAKPTTPKYIYHTGWWKGYNTLMWFSPTDKFVVIILSNKYNRSIYQIKPLLEILHGRSMGADSLEVED